MRPLRMKTGGILWERAKHYNPGRRGQAAAAALLKSGLTSDRAVFPDVTVALSEFLMLPTLALIGAQKHAMHWQPGGPWHHTLAGGPQSSLY